MAFLYRAEMLSLNKVNQNKLGFSNAEKSDYIISLWWSIFTERTTSPMHAAWL